MEIKKLRVSFIWVRTSFRLFEPIVTTTGNDAPLFSYPFRVSDFKDTIRKLYSENDLPVTLPWNDGSKGKRYNWFWRYYLRGNDPMDGYPHISSDTIGKISGLCANLILPFRVSLNQNVKLVFGDKLVSGNSWNKSNTFSFEGYLYRHGAALITTFNICNCAELEEAVGWARAARFDPVFQYKSNATTTLKSLADELLNELCEMMKVQAGINEDHPFSIAAIDAGDPDLLLQPVQQNSPVHKALDALSTWNSAWDQVPLPNLADRTIDMQNNKQGDVIYGDKHSRVLWLPRLFVPEDKNKKTFALRWYYRNLLLASMQVSSLSALMAKAVSNQNIQTNMNLRNYLIRVRAIISEMQADSNDTYHSMSIKKQINDCTVP